MKKIFTLLSLSFLTFLGNSQVLGIYEFTGAQICPVENPNVTTQPIGATFSAFTAASSLTCAATANVFNNQTWSTVFDDTKFYEFTVIANANYSIALDSITFASRISGVGTTCSWHLRSSLDNFQTDITTGTNIDAMQTFRYKLNTNSAFNTISSVTFRFYFSGMDQASRACRIDDVTLKGTTTTTLSLNEKSDLVYSFYPNPGKESLSLNLNENLEDAKVSIFSTSGQVVYALTFSGSSTSINTVDLKAGMYFIELRDGNNISTFKWIKE